MIGKRGFKRGQITVWIILGIVILAVVGGTVYIKTSVLKSDWEKGREKAAKVPQQIVPVKNFIDSCIESVGRDAIDLVGMQGGYTNLPEDLRLSIFPNRALEVSYWYYQKENGIDVVNVPSLNFIQNQISDHVNSKLIACLNEFKELKEAGYKITTGDINTKTEIGDKKVFLTVDLPIRIEFKDLIFNINKHYTLFDVDLWKLYELATDILRKESEDLFLEEETIDLLIVYDEIPFSGSEFRCSPRIWLRQDVINKFKNILFNNIQFVKIKGTDHVFPNKYYKRFLWDIGTRKNYKGIRSDFMFSENWQLDLDVFPRKGDILKSESITGNLGPATGLAQSFFCLQDYHFIYDIKYPILVKLSDMSSFDGEGYTFQFVTQVVIDNNQPRRSVIIPPSVQEGVTRYCDKRFVESTIFTFEKDLDGNLEPLEDAIIGYRCINHFCDIGKTEIDIYGDASLTAKFPSCINGEIVAEKEGYHLVKEQVSTNERLEIPLILEPYLNKNYEVKVISKGDYVREIFPSEKVIMQLVEANKDYSLSVIYPDDEEIKLIPGIYTVNAFLMREGKIKIDDMKIEKCIPVPRAGVFGALGVTEEKCVETTLLGGVFDNVITGTIEFEFTITDDNLKHDYIEFYIPSEGIPKNLEEMAKITFEIPENFIYPRFLNE